jgi:NMD protein affecting ribosome stability and mRNA decay
VSKRLHRLPPKEEPCIRCGASTAKWPGLATLCVKCRVETNADAGVTPQEEESK